MAKLESVIRREILTRIPASPNALDDEFDDSSFSGWTVVNDPAGGDAVSETDFPGFIHVGLTELGATDDFTTLIQIYKTAPTGTSTMTFVARVAIANVSGTSALTDAAEFGAIGIALINSTNSEAVGVALQLNDAFTGGSDNLPLSPIGFENTFSGFGSTVHYPTVRPSEFVHIRLRKTTASAYTSSNTYEMDYSLTGNLSDTDGLWHNIASGSKTFTTACDRVGFVLRRPKSATGTPYCNAMADFFRRTV